MCAGKHGSLGICVRETRYAGETYITVTPDLQYANRIYLFIFITVQQSKDYNAQV